MIAYSLLFSYGDLEDLVDLVPLLQAPKENN